jgi:hypothetical protein
VIALSDEERERFFSIFDELQVEHQDKAPFYLAACSGLLRLMLATLHRKLPREACECSKTLAGFYKH